MDTDMIKAEDMPWCAAYKLYDFLKVAQLQIHFLIPKV